MKHFLYLLTLGINILSSCTKQDMSKYDSPVCGKWQCIESSEPNGIFIKDYVYSFDKSGIFYNIYDGEEYERGVFHANDRDLYINIGSSLIHWEIQSCKDSELMLYSTRSGYTPGICKLVRL